MERAKIRHKYLFIAVKPEYANKLISGKKDIELRKMKPNVEAWGLCYHICICPC